MPLLRVCYASAMPLLCLEPEQNHSKAIGKGEAKTNLIKRQLPLGFNLLLNKVLNIVVYFQEQGVFLC
jgi:hypothetical protein